MITIRRWIGVEHLTGLAYAVLISCIINNPMGLNMESLEYKTLSIPNGRKR